MVKKIIKVRFLMRLKERKLASTLHGFLKVQSKGLLGLISDYVNMFRLGKINKHSFFKVKIKTVYDYILLQFTFFASPKKCFPHIAYFVLFSYVPM